MSIFAGLHDFVEALDSNGVPYGIIGGLAVFAYGGERTTFDVDFLVHGDFRDPIKETAKKLSLKIVNENAEVLQFAGTTQIDIVFANRPKSQEMLKRTRKVGSFPYLLVSPEDLVGLKIQAFAADRSREFIDKGDIFTIFKNVQQLNFEKIKEYADIFGLWNEIEEIRKRI